MIAALMLVEVLGAYGGESLGCRLTCLLVEGSLAVDAGCLSQALPVGRQAEVRSILLTHSHLDHTRSLPFFVENVLGKIDHSIDLYASRETLDAVRNHFFNDALWPDITRLPDPLGTTLRFHELEPEVPVEIEGTRVTPIPVSHSVPTFGFLLERAGSSFIWSSDTGPTERLWQVANEAEGLAAICVETSFDNSLQEVADLSGHLTPRTLERELEKLDRSVPVLLHHLKPPSIGAIRREVKRLGLRGLDLLEQGSRYQFS